MVQKLGDTDIKAVLAFNNKVNKTIESANEPVIIYGLNLFPDSEIEPPIITGNKGRMHGAKTVKAPAIKEITSKAILIYFRN